MRLRSRHVENRHEPFLALANVLIQHLAAGCEEEFGSVKVFGVSGNLLYHMGFPVACKHSSKM